MCAEVGVSRARGFPRDRTVVVLSGHKGGAFGRRKWFQFQPALHAAFCGLRPSSLVTSVQLQFYQESSNLTWSCRIHFMSLISVILI